MHGFQKTLCAGVLALALGYGSAVRAELAPQYSVESGMHWQGLVYGNFGVVTPGSGFNAGMRLEVDYKWLAFLGQIDASFPSFNAAASGLSLRESLLLGANPVNKRLWRLRILVGADFAQVATLSQDGDTQFGIPSFNGWTGIAPIWGASTRVGPGVFGLDASFLMTAWPYWMFDVRAALAIRIFFVQVHAGWRYFTMGLQKGDFASFQRASQSANGPYVAVGFGW